MLKLFKQVQFEDLESKYLTGLKLINKCTFNEITLLFHKNINTNKVSRCFMLFFKNFKVVTYKVYVAFVTMLCY